MSPRRRSEKRRNFPDNLYETGGYYSWKHPGTGEHFGLGRIQQREAFREAIRANAAVGAIKPSLVERITGAANTWLQWCDVFEKKLAERDAAANTKKTRRSQLKRLRTCFHGKLAVEVSTKDCAEIINAIKAEGKFRTAQAFRSFLIDCFDRMIAEGWRTDNPASVLDEVKVKVRRARLPLDVFLTIYAKPTLKRWLRNAMALSLVSGQGREECAFSEFIDVHDGCWWSERSKTGARILLPLELRLVCFGMSLDDVIKQCRATGILSRHIIHQTERAKGARLGKKMHIAQLTREFTAEVRALGIDWGEKKPPTFHEIRSLSGRLYKAQGDVNPQELLGHKDPRTTAIYTDGRGEWVRVGIRK